MSSTAFKTSAVIFALLVPGHIKYGLDVVYKGQATLQKKSPKLSKTEDCALYGGLVTWDAFNFTATGMALLNYQYSTTGGPQTDIEKAVFAVFTLGTFVSAFRYGIVKDMAPTIGLSLASGASVLGYFLA